MTERASALKALSELSAAEVSLYSPATSMVGTLSMALGLYS